MSFDNAASYSTDADPCALDTVDEALEAWAESLDPDAWRAVQAAAGENERADYDAGVMVYGFDELGEQTEGEAYFTASDIVEILRAHMPSWFKG